MSVAASSATGTDGDLVHSLADVKVRGTTLDQRILDVDVSARQIV
jgi:hypothetical protein